MKKLMIAACAVALAAVAQAASVNWMASYVMQPGTTSMASDYYGIMFAVEDYALETAKSDFASGKFDAIAGFGLDGKTSNSTGTYTLSGYATKDAGTYNFYAVIFNADSANSADKFFVTSSKPATIADGDGNETTVDFGMLASSTMVADNWTDISSAPVPEPTSGLLMLIGMAGLALRRRRA